MSTEEVIRKIAKLRALATSSNLHEAEAAARAAATLAEKYRISEAEVEDASPTPTEQPTEADEPIDVVKRFVAWRCELALALSRRYGCALYWSLRGLRAPDGRMLKTRHLKIVGRRSDCEIVRYMFAWLAVELARIAKRDRETVSWLRGAVDGIGQQLTAGTAEARRAATVTVTTLVKIDARAEESELALRTLKGKLGAGPRSRALIDGEAFARGQVHGRSIHLGSSLDTTTTRRLTG
jgi:hypothetical protein